MKIHFRSYGCITADIAERNRVSCRARGVPCLGVATRPHLAVVGGGPSSARFPLDWSGDIWAINGAWRWLKQRGVDAWFYSVDPQPIVADLARGADRAILSSSCDPSVFDAVKYAEAFDIPAHGWGPTSAAVSTIPAVMRGYAQVSYFGCESSFVGDDSHIYAAHEVPDLMTVSVGGERFYTKPGFLVQAELLAEVMRAAPEIYRDESGGLLGALVEHGEYDVLEVSKLIAESLEWSADVGV